MTKFLADASEKRLDRFELIAELASGGMATVYLGRLSGVGGFQRFVAIKRLHPHLANDPEFIQMFLDEARLAARLHHPNVVPILEIGTTEQGYYLVMEYVEGDTLARLLARSIQAGKPLPLEVGIRIIADTLAGLHAAHELTDDDGKPLHIVHRDVSPQNVLLGMDGIARITDFGVARAASRLTTTRSGQLKGKLAYMAPEQARGKEVDRRADVFAMGIVLWETLAQKRLFKGEGEAETLNRVLFEPIPTLLSANPRVPAEIDAICMKALDRDPEKRFATCTDFGDALEKAARNAGVLGTHKEVSTHIQAVIGTDISQQRDALRAWLTRSEPSRQSLPRVPASGPKTAESSSVSSAVIALQPVPSSPSSVVPVSQPRASRGLLGAIVVLLAAACVLGIVFLMKTSGAKKDHDTTVATQPLPPPSPTQTAGEPPVVSAPAASTVASTTTTTTATTAKPPTVGTGRKFPPVRPTTTVTSTASPTTTKTNTLPDENPYR